MKSAARDAALVGVCAALLLAGQIAMSSLPNIEIVSLFVIVFAQCFGRKTLYIIYVFALLEGLVYGFGIWWIMYLYVWTVLYLAARAMKNESRPLAIALLSGAFGLLFGALCSIPYFFILGVGGGITYFVQGIMFDLLHCAGNFVLALVLYKPLMRTARLVSKTFEQNGNAGSRGLAVGAELTPNGDGQNKT